MKASVAAPSFIYYYILLVKRVTVAASGTDYRNFKFCLSFFQYYLFALPPTFTFQYYRNEPGICAGPV